MRLIDADVLKSKVEALVTHKYNESDYEYGRNQALDYVADILIDDAPTIEAAQGWIPCSERLPEAENMYQPPKQRYLCQLEAYGERKFCVLSRLKGAASPFWDWYGVAFHDPDVTAWMPLPKPYKGGDSE